MRFVVDGPSVHPDHIYMHPIHLHIIITNNIHRPGLQQNDELLCTREILEMHRIVQLHLGIHSLFPVLCYMVRSGLSSLREYAVCAAYVNKLHSLQCLLPQSNVCCYPFPYSCAQSDLHVTSHSPHGTHPLASLPVHSRDAAAEEEKVGKYG